MARIDTFDDSHWDEVKIINGYAVFMGYLMMGVRGLGVLVVTWSTVVLLGGFVSVLGKKDFLCLTGITLVQTVGVFNFLLEETLRDFVCSWWGLLAAAVATIAKLLMKGKDISNVPGLRIVAAAILSLVLSAIQTLVLVIILCPVVVLYMFGMYISAGVGLWRLIEHDFSNAEGGTNLKPALEVLYSLAVAQGLLFGYKTLHGLGAKFGLADFAAGELGIVDKKLIPLISDYLEGTVAGCEKDPSFATGRNLVTYGMDLMVEAKSNDGFIAGITVLGTVVDLPSRGELVKHLLPRSTSFTHTLQRLLETLVPISQYRGEIREHTARIVALVAHSIFLEQHQSMLQSVRIVLGDLTRALLDAGDISNRVHAARMLRYLCPDYTKGGEYLKELKNAIANVMPEVLKEVLCYWSRIEAVTEASNVQLQEIVVSASGDIPHGNAQANTSSSQQQQGEQPEEKKLWEELVDLCFEISRELYGKDTELAQQLDEIAEKVCSEQGKPVQNFRDLTYEASVLLVEVSMKKE